MKSSQETIELTTCASERTDRGHNGEPSGLNWLEQCACSIVKAGRIPQHVAFIMDGNRRFAREHGMEVANGHKMGYEKLEQVLRWCCELGVHGVTVYAFSIENFKRPQQEVDALMALAEEGLREMSGETHLVQRRGVRVRVVGDLSRVSASLYDEMQRVMRMTQGNTRHTLTVCFSYTSRHEIAASVGKLCRAVAERRLRAEDVCAELLEGCLLTSSPGLPAVDLIVRTSGEKRLSDFLLWQSATCAVVFTAVRWPEFSLLRFLGILLRHQRAVPYLDGVGIAALERAPLHTAEGTCGSCACAQTMLEPSSRRCVTRVRAAAWAAVGARTVLGVLGLVAATLATALRLSGRAAASDALAAAAAALVSWLFLALCFPVDGGSGAVPAALDKATRHDPAQRPQHLQRVRDFLADLNVDRRR